MVEIRHRYTNAVLYEADVSDVREAVQQAVKEGANLAGAYLAGANLTGAKLARAYLAGAYLTDANLADANLADANLAGAKLAGANLTGAKLAGAYFAGAYLTDARGIAAERRTPLLMLMDQPGPIRAYKLVTADGEGPMFGGIKYEVGQSYEVEDAETNPAIHCGPGINVATLDWCLREYRDGQRVLVVEFTADDIAAIPTATDGKFRLHRCKVVGEKDVATILAPEKAGS